MEVDLICTVLYLAVGLINGELNVQHTYVYVYMCANEADRSVVCWSVMFELRHCFLIGCYLNQSCSSSPPPPPQGEFLMNTGSLGVVGVSSGSSNVSKRKSSQSLVVLYPGAAKSCSSVSWQSMVVSVC